MTIGDFATTVVEGTFSVAYLVFNTIMNLTTQDEQVACFHNAAAHLEPGGRFVIEVGRAGAPAAAAGRDGAGVHGEPDAARLRRVRRRLAGADLAPLLGVDGALEASSIPFRYVWPAELDLMARLAGMTLRERWADWKRTPFTSESTGHVSVWETSRR